MLSSLAGPCNFCINIVKYGKFYKKPFFLYEIETMKTVKVGLVGFGTIGTGVAKLLLLQQNRISQRTGYDVRLVKIVDLDTTRDRGIALPEGMLSPDYHDILNDPEISVVVQLIGGTGIERKIMLEMIAAGKNIVTANKALLANSVSEYSYGKPEKGRLGRV